MSKGLKVWLWFALVLSVATTIMNASFGRWPSVIIAIGAIVGLSVLLFAQKKWGFTLLCVCYLLSFGVGVLGGISGGTGMLASVGMSLVGSLFIPGVTYLLLRFYKF